MPSPDPTIEPAPQEPPAPKLGILESAASLEKLADELAGDISREAGAAVMFLNRELLLGLAGKLKEAEVELDGVGKVLVRELTGAERAEIVGKQAEAFQEKKVDINSYHRRLLLKALVDPSSPEGARQPLLKAADVDHVMRLGGKTIARLIEKIEELSGLGAGANQRAEGNSEPTPSESSTSG